MKNIKKVKPKFSSYKNLFLFLIIFGGFLFFSGEAMAADCGDTNSDGVTDTTCNCGDSVVGAPGYTYELESDLTCTGHGLLFGTSTITIDGNGYIITGDGDSSDYGIYNNGFDYATTTNITITDFYGGIYYNNADNGKITHSTTIANSHGIYLDSSSNNTLINNTANFNINYGIYFFSSSNNTLINNTANSNFNYNSMFKPLTYSNYGIYFQDSFNNTLTNNIISNNIDDIRDVGNDGSNTYSLNQISHNAQSRMLTFTEIRRVKAINDTIDFSFSMFDAQGNACYDCIPTVISYPSEAVSTVTSSNNATSTFTVTQNGMYSLNIKITDIGGNFVKRKFIFLVGDIDSETTKYYLRSGHPTHGQPFSGPNNDAQTMLLTPPTSDEYWYCTVWVQNSPDELPPAHSFALMNLDSINIHSYYDTWNSGFIGVQRFVSFSSTVDQRQSVPAGTPPNGSTLADNDFSLDWMMDYQKHWYWLSLKLTGTVPRWYSRPSQPSYADFTYSYTTTPAIKSNSNEDIIILSATATSSISSISLENPTSAITTTNLVLTDFNSPFLNAASTITSDATTTIATGNISTSTPLTLNSLNIPITPASGFIEVLATDSLIDLDYDNSTLTGLTINSIDREINLNNQDNTSMIITLPSGSLDITIDSWLMTGTQNKQWTATSTTATSTIYTIGDLKANTYYQFKLDNTASTTAITNDSVCTDGICKSDENGQIIFTYVGGYSTHTFGLEEDITGPISFSLSSPSNNYSSSANSPTFFWNASSDTESGLSHYQLYIDNSLDTDNISGTSVSPSNALSCGNHTWYIKAVDNAGNSTNSETFNLTRSCGGGIPIWMLNQTNQNQNQDQDSDDATDNNQDQSTNNNKTIIEKIKQKVFAYSKSRLKSLFQEQNSAKTLKQELEKHYGKNKIPVHRKHWHTIVNSYIYGNYPIQAIIQAIKFGGKTVHPTIPFSAWQKAGDYLEWIGK